MVEINFLEQLHTSTKRNYLERVNPAKPYCCEIAKKFGPEYWDGDRRYGYGGYIYDRRWQPIAEAMAAYYNLQPGDKILDVGCGKGFLLNEFANLGMDVYGLDVSGYALSVSPIPESRLVKSGADDLPWDDNTFDLVYSINTLHNLEYPALVRAIAEMQRVGKEHKWFCVESYRTEKEKCNMLNWQLTAESFYRPGAWKEIAERNGYDGDIGFIYFE